MFVLVFTDQNVAVVGGIVGEIVGVIVGGVIGGVVLIALVLFIFRIVIIQVHW